MENRRPVVRGSPGWRGLAAVFPGLVLLIGCLAPGPLGAGSPLLAFSKPREVNPAPESRGPTLYLEPGRGGSRDNSVVEFMYFVPLISLEPVSVIRSPGNTQRARMLSITRAFRPKSFLVTGEFEFDGSGTQQTVFDHTDELRRHERELREGGSLDHQLGSINVEGAGTVTIEVKGTMNGHVPTVREVRLQFNAHGRPSLVTISLRDIGYSDGEFRIRRETIARVNTLTFRRKPGPTKMDITVASVKPKDAGDNFWGNIMGGVKAVTVNLFLKPIAVEPAGNEAILDFGLALASEATTFTFPRARNLNSGGTGAADGATAKN